MFTGIIQCVGVVSGSDLKARDLRLTVDARELVPQTVGLGDSVAVNGVCLTVVENNDYRLRFDVSAETLALSRLGGLVVGSKVNLELAMRASDRLGGHFVYGHVDGVGKLVATEPVGSSVKMVFAVPAAVQRYIAPKGSICIDGVSLTVNEVNANGFSVNVVPHTLQATTLGDYRLEQAVNLEVDIIARYLEQLLADRQPATKAPITESEQAEGITTQFLSEHGFLAPDLEQDDANSVEKET